MKKINTILFSAVALFLASCENMLETKVDNQYGDEYTWTLPDKAQGVLMQAYSAIPKTWDVDYSNVFLDVATDNAVCGDLTKSMYKMMQGAYTNNTNPMSNWGTCYAQFYNINLFLERGLTDEVVYKLSDKNVNEAYKRRLKGEAHFLRAWWGAELLRTYGGVTNDGEALGYWIVTESAQDIKENIQYERNSYEECVLQILSDCDTALAYLPMQYSGSEDEVTAIINMGRADGRAAHALKSRVALYAASKAYQPSGIYFISQDSISKKWERAARLSQVAITEGAYGSYGGLTEKHFNDVSKTPNEFLFRKYTNNRDLENRNYPPMFRGNAFTQPSQNLVDAFPAINGYPIEDPRSNFDPYNPYLNRDPRLDLTVYYNGRTFDNRPLEIFTDEEAGSLGKDVAGFNYKNTRTGYYLRKWLSQKPEMLVEGVAKNDFHQHALLRISEVYLNYAEASNEAVGPNAFVPYCNMSAIEIVKAIRAAVGIVGEDSYVDEVAALGKEEFRKLIQNERRLELAFENHRFFDMRRWMLPMNETIQGVECTRSFVLDDNTELFSYKTVNVESRSAWSDEKYFYTPLPYDELARNPLLKDNKGW